METCGSAAAFVVFDQSLTRHELLQLLVQLLPLSLFDRGLTKV
jgi:hypothetical protein